MNETAVSRRTALKALGTTAGALAFLPWLSEEGLAAFAEVQKTGAAPALKAMTAAQYATTEALVEALIPADERSPGAKEARVADYIDLILAEAKPEPRKEWLDGLAALDAEATTRHGAPFLKLSPEKVEALLTDISRFERKEETKEPGQDPALEISRNQQPQQEKILVEGLLGDVSYLDPASRRTPLEEFFEVTKRATIHGYYTSEIGIHKELRYKGNQVLAEFVGCLTQDGKDCPHCGQKAGA